MARTEAELAARVLAMDSPVGIEEIWETTEGQAARAADADAVALCRAAQAEFDSTKERAALEGVPWIPADLKQVVRVAFGCTPEER